MNSRPRLIIGALLMCCGSVTAFADEPVAIETVTVTENISMLVGRGGNVAVSSGVDGVFVIDDQYAAQYPGIKAAISAISTAPVRFLLNTHWHNDHTGGNAAMATDGAVIVAHENVRKRLSSDQIVAFFKSEVPASPALALPIVTFTSDLAFHFNADDIHVFHVANAHTDGDAVIRFSKANVIHTGDVFFNGLYPFIDSGSGGSVAGTIAAADRILAIADPNTRIIPGHGPLSDRKGLQAYRDMLEAVQHAVANLMIAGNSIEQVVAAHPTAPFDAQWGNGFLAPDAFVRLVVDSLTRTTLD